MKKLIAAVKAKVLPSKPAPAPLTLPDRAPFYAVVRKEMGALSQSQVDGFEHVFKHFYDSTIPVTVALWMDYLAYMFATAWHETACTMQPVAEYGRGKGRSYGKPDKRTGFTYYGRGLVQLTHYENYKLYGIEKDPEKACDPDMAAHIMIDGMVKGRFTGKRLDNYFAAKVNDPVGARRIINGVDQAVKIARYHKTFLKGIQEMSKPEVKLG